MLQTFLKYSHNMLVLLIINSQNLEVTETAQLFSVKC